MGSANGIVPSWAFREGVAERGVGVAERGVGVAERGRRGGGAGLRCALKGGGGTIHSSAAGSTAVSPKF